MAPSPDQETTQANGTQRLLGLALLVAVSSGLGAGIIEVVAYKLQHHEGSHGPRSRSVYPIDQITFERGASSYGDNSKVDSLQFDAPETDDNAAARHSYSYPTTGHPQAAAEAASALAFVPGAKWDLSGTAEPDFIWIEREIASLTVSAEPLKRPELEGYSYYSSNKYRVQISTDNPSIANARMTFTTEFSDELSAREFVAGLAGVSRWADEKSVLLVSQRDGKTYCKLKVQLPTRD